MVCRTLICLARFIAGLVSGPPIMSEPQFCGADHTGEPIFVGQLCRSVVNPVRFGEVLGTNFIGADFAVVELRGIGPDHGKSFRVEDVDLLPLDILDLIALESR